MAYIRPRTPWARWKLGTVVALAIAALLGACGSPDGADNGGNGGRVDASALSCGAPNTGCSCSPDGATVSCGYVKESAGNFVTCAEGTRTCTGGLWGPCVATYTTFQSNEQLGGNGITLQSLGMNSDAGNAGDAGQSNCAATPCDPTCQTFIDNSVDAEAGPGLVATPDGGWTLPGEGGTLVIDASTACTVTLKGIVYDPASLEPVFNAVVAIPTAGTPAGSGTPPAIPTGVPVTSSCTGGFPAVVAAYTLKDGSFQLTGVPVQSTVTVVIQIGNWRRLVTLNTSACTCGGTIDITNASDNTNPICVTPAPSSCAGAGNYAGTASCLTRLPRIQSEGNIPHIALASGGCDPMECLVYRMGVAGSEFTDENGAGRVHYFYGHGAGLKGGANHTLPVLEGLNSGIQDTGFETSGSNQALSGWYPGPGGNGWVGWGSGKSPSPNGGKYYGVLGASWFACGKSPCGQQGEDMYSQTFTAPPGATTLTYYDYPECLDGKSYFQTSLVDLTAGTMTSSATSCVNGKAWAKGTMAVTAGHAYTVNFINYDGTGNGSRTAIDDITLDVANNSPANLLNHYDLTMLPCDCGLEYNWSWGTDVDDPGRSNLVSFANGGGRVFTSHWGREWIERAGTTKALGSGPFPGAANWYSSSSGVIGTYAAALSEFGAGTCEPSAWVGNTWFTGSTCSTTGYLDTASTRSQNFAAWMGVTAGSSTTMTIDPSRYDVSSITASSVGFVYGRSDGNGSTKPDEEFDFTFDTPLGGTALGRVMFTDMHLASGKLNPNGAEGPIGWGANVGGNDYRFPDECPAQGTALSQQELAAEYLLFDLGQCVTGTPIASIPPLQITGNGTNAACSGGSAKDIIPGTCVTNADCEMDFHCAGGKCVWSGGDGYVDPTCTDSSGNPAVDLTFGVPCASGAGFQLPICNRGTAKLSAGAVIKLEDSGNGGAPSAAWNCAAPPTPNPPSVSGGADTCSYTLPFDLGPGQCFDVDTTTTAGAACAILEQGERYLYVNYDQSIPECGTGFSGSGPGCMNNTTHTKATGNSCPPTCGVTPPSYKPATFTRDFDGVCPAGNVPVWHLFTWAGVTPLDSSLDFKAWTADTEAQLGVQYPTAVTLENPAPDNHANGYVDSQNYSTDVDTRLLAGGYPGSGTPPHASHTWLRVNMVLTPSSDASQAPTLLSWNQAYDCVASE